MATRNIVPRATGEGSLGTSVKHWGNIYADNGTIAGRNIANDGAMLATHETEITDLQNQVTTLEHAYAGAKAAATVADMTDHNQIYVYVGSETGYTNGNWYYWNGTAWVSGGVYNATALETDKTLTVSGAAADALSAGELIRMVENSDLHKLITSPETDAVNIITEAQGTNNQGLDENGNLQNENGHYTIQFNFNSLPSLALRYLYTTAACEYVFLDSSGYYNVTKKLSTSSAGFIKIPKDDVGFVRFSFVGDLSNCQQKPVYAYSNHIVFPSVVSSSDLFESTNDLHKININNYNYATAQNTIKSNSRDIHYDANSYVFQFNITPDVREKIIVPRIYAKNAGKVLFLNSNADYCAYSYREFNDNATIIIPEEAAYVRFSFPSPNGMINSNNDPVYILISEPVVKKYTVGGENGTFSGIKEALDHVDSYDTHDAATRIEIHVAPGTYEISDVKYLGFLNYVDIIGDDPTTTIVKHIASTTVYDATKAGFDPAYYANQKIYNATIKNLTIITEGCKCPIHIDGDNIVNGGKITIENCVLLDQNGAQMNLEDTDDYGLHAGGVNCGLGNGQTVVVKDCFSNGRIYAHNHANSTIPSTFIIDGCVARNSMIGSAYVNNIKDTYIIKNTTLDYLTFQTLYCTKNAYIVKLSNNHINFIYAPSNHQPYVVFDTFFGGKCGIYEGSCLCFAFNDSDYAINRGDFVEYVSDANDRGVKAPLFVKSATGNAFAGMAMEDIAAKSIGLVQYRGKFSIPAIVGANNGDFVDFVNGGFVLHASGNTPVGRYGAPSILVSGEYFVCID
jgi:hypothetical protein